MPVPDSYSRRYGREETTYSTSYTTRGTRASYLSSYSSKQSTSLPPRPPSLYGTSDALRKYGIGDPTSSITSRYLTSSTAPSRLRDYGTSSTGAGYRSSVSPVRATATASSALRTSIADRIKAMEIDKDDDSPIRSYSRYTTLRNRDPLPSSSSSRAYTSSFARDRSNSREYGVSPLASSAILNHRERDSSLNRSSVEARKRGSPSPTSALNGIRKDSSGSAVAVTNGQSSSEVTKNSSSSDSSCASTLGVASFPTTTKPLQTTSTSTDANTDNSVIVDAHVVVGDAVNAVSESSRACTQCRDFENNDVDCVKRSPSGDTKPISDPEVAPTNASVLQEVEASPPTTFTLNKNSNSQKLGMVQSNGNGDDESGSKKDSNSVVVMVVQDSRNKKVNSVASSALKETVIGGGGSASVKEAPGVGEQALGSSSPSTIAAAKVMENDSNGNPISMDKSSNDPAQEGPSKARYGKKDGACSTSTTRSASASTKPSSGLARRRRESDSNANNLVESSPQVNGVSDDTPSLPDDVNKVSIKVNREASPHESFTISKPRRSSSASASGSKVIYHTIKVEDSVTKSPSPEPISYTVKVPISSASITDNKNSESTPPAQKSSADTSAEFKVSLPRRRSSTVKADSPGAPGSTESHCNGNLESDAGEDSKSKMNSYKPASSRIQRKSGSPIEKANQKKNEEDSSSSIEDEQEKNRSKAKARSSNTPTRSVGASTAVARKSKSKSPSPRVTSASTAEASGRSSRYLNGEKSSENVNGHDTGAHTSKFSYGESSPSLATNRNDKKSRYPHLSGASAAVASDSSDNDSDAYSSSPQLGGRFRSRDAHERSGLTGLRNIGNTCFMNSVLQCLSNTKPLLEYLLKDNYNQDINQSTSAMKGSLIRAFSEVIQELWREQRVVDTSAFKDQIQKFAPRFMGYSQQDAQEFLRYLLEGLHEDVNRVTSKPTPILTDIDDSLSDSQKAAEAWKRYLRYEDSRIVDLFVGQLRSTLKCTVCGNCSVTFDPFWDLSLPIPSRSGSTRLAQCFELFNKEEVLDGDEKPTCSKCQCRRKCTKSFTIQKFPRILVIHLKRFSPTERYRGKLSTLVDCPINSLDLSPYAANRGQALSYNLYGVANHSGSTYSGHYIASCKHPYSGEWHSYNDSRVSPISTHQVITTEGYVLFYEQTGQSS